MWHKFLMAQASRAEYLTENVIPKDMSILNLPGHFFYMVGFRNADDVVYLADHGGDNRAKSEHVYFLNGMLVLLLSFVKKI